MSGRWLLRSNTSDPGDPLGASGSPPIGWRGSDRRIGSRHRLESNTTWFPPVRQWLRGVRNAPQPCVVEDVSISGALITAPANPAIRAGMTITLATRSGQQTAVTVRSIRPDAEDPSLRCYGVEFADPSAGDVLRTERA